MQDASFSMEDAPLDSNQLCANILGEIGLLWANDTVLELLPVMVYDFVLHKLQRHCSH